MAKYVKLGKKAKGGSFFEPTHQLSVYGGKVVKVTNQAAEHPVTRRAINGGHLVMSNKEEYDKYLETDESAMKLHKANLTEESKASDEDDDEEDDFDFRTLNKKPLIAYALTLEGFEFTEDELNDFTKDEIYNELDDFLSTED